MLGCSQSPRDVTTAAFLKMKLVKNVVGLQKFAQELRVSYKPTDFRRWVVDEVCVTNRGKLRRRNPHKYCILCKVETQRTHPP